MLRENIVLDVEKYKQAFLSLNHLGQQQIIDFFNLVRNKKLFARGQPLEHGLGFGQVAVVLDVLAVSEKCECRKSSDPKLSSFVQLGGHDEDDSVFVEVGVDLLEAVDHFRTFFAVVVVSAESGEQDGDVLVLCRRKN